MSIGLNIVAITAAIAVLFCGLLIVALKITRRSRRCVKNMAPAIVPNKLRTAEQYAGQQTAFIDHQSNLQQRFFSRVSKSGKPKGLTWKSCKFDEATTWAIEKQSANLHALLSVVIHFEAVPGGPMEDVEAVGNARIATAIFFYDGIRWDTRGDILFNLEPHEVLTRHCDDYDLYQ